MAPNTKFSLSNKSLNYVNYRKWDDCLNFQKIFFCRLHCNEGRQVESEYCSLSSTDEW